jgi:hypothetical protein
LSECAELDKFNDAWKKLRSSIRGEFKTKGKQCETLLENVKINGVEYRFHVFKRIPYLQSRTGHKTLF